MVFKSFMKWSVNLLKLLLSCFSRVFNPTLIHAENNLSLMKMMKSLTQQLHMLGIISTNINDNAYEQYQDFIKSNFDLISYEDSDRLDEFFFQTLKTEWFPVLAKLR